MNRNYPVIGYMSVWPSRRIVRVKVERVNDNSGYPFTVSSLEPNVDIANGLVLYQDQRKVSGFRIASMDVIKIYRSRRQAEKIELELLHKEYAAQRREARNQARKMKWALRRVEEFKAFKLVQTPFFQ